MRKEEAEEVIKIMLQCDGGCEYCASSLLKLFGDKFPEHESIAKLAFKKEFGIKLEDFLDQKHKPGKWCEALTESSTKKGGIK